VSSGNIEDATRVAIVALASNYLASGPQSAACAIRIRNGRLSTGDGRFDTRKVFTDDCKCSPASRSGMRRGGACPPKLLFIPERKSRRYADAAEVVLDGFTGSPEIITPLPTACGSVGRMAYGRCGASSSGGMACRARLRSNASRCAVPFGVISATQIVEALSSGTTNPWGHD